MSIIGRVKSVRDPLEEHDETSDEIGDSRILDEDAEEEYDAARGHVEQHKDEDEPPERVDRRYESNRAVDDRSKDEGRDHSEGDDVEQELGGEVGDGGVVSIGSLAGEEEAFGSEGVDGGEASESEEGGREEEDSHAVLETRDVVAVIARGQRERWEIFRVRT
jgi:hypothetical protein